MKRLLILVLAFTAFSCTRTTKFELMKPDFTGIHFNNSITESDSFNVFKYEYIYNGAGVGVADFNNDGLQDLIFAGNKVSSKVYLNLGNFKFRDITSNFRGLDNSQWFSGVTIADINGDGYPDVYLTSTKEKDPQKRKNRFWVSNGKDDKGVPLYTEMAEKYGIADTSYSVNAAFFDYDLDGNLDLYVLNNSQTSRMNTNFRAKVTDGSAPNNDHLYHNNGDGTFTELSEKAGIVYEGFGLGIAVSDFNKDGYPDIYISNDFISNDLLYINQKNGTFKNEIAKYISYQSRSSMGDDVADVNNDGYPDIYSLDMLPESYYKKKQTINGNSYRQYLNEAKFGFEHQYVRNMLHLNNGVLNGELIPFSEAGQMKGISATEWSWSPLFADYDNDGDKDLIIANGYPVDETDKDWTRFWIQVQGQFSGDLPVLETAPKIKIPNFAYENKGDGSFTKRTDWMPQHPSYSYGAAFVDLDNDGDLDYICNNINDEAFVLKNTTRERQKKESNYLEIKLDGNKPNTAAIGATVELWANGKYQFAENFLTRGYASTVYPLIHFGLGNSKKIDSIRVHWPADGLISVLKNQNANHLLEVSEKDTGKPGKNLKATSNKNLLFERCDKTIDYSHEQNDFVDFQLNQPIIPHKFSQIGPAMAKGDINGDGIEDIITGATNSSPTKVFIRKGDKFGEAAFEGLTTKKECSESDLAIFDIDGDGHNDIVASAGGYENINENEYKHFAYLNRNGKFIQEPLPIPAFPASVIRPCDFDHDGSIDFFIGARVKKGMFPYSNHSWIVHNVKGKLTADTTFRLNLGMVTDAVWTDYDNDGWEDLLVTREYNSLVLLRNIKGTRFEPLIIPSLEKWHGIWNTIIAGDFDQDGDEDYIVGNLGENNRYTVSEQYPLSLYAIDIDMDGNIDPVQSAYWPDKNGKMTEYPVNYLDELVGQCRFFDARFKDYTTFSYTSLPEMFTPKISKRIQFKLFVNTTSSYILWNNKGSFSWEKLPDKLQEGPVTKLIVTDLNGDNYPDVIVGGNNYSYDVSTGIYDSNKGFVLLNKGKGHIEGTPSFDVLSPSESGLLLQGMVGSMLWFKGDTSLAVVGFNRSKTEVFRHVSLKH